MKNKSKLIYSSTDYASFTKDVFNRVVRSNPKLKKSMEKYGWLDAFPMLVVLRDGKKMIKDGQHRFDIAVELKAPVKYVVSEEDGLQASEISVGLSWSLSDFVTSFAQQGKTDYQRLISFKNETGLPLRTCAALLYGHANGSALPIREGTFRVRNEAHARAVVSVLHAAGQVVKWSSNQYFVSAVSQAISYAKINVGTICDKIRSHPGKLILQPTVDDFVSMLEGLYNYRNREAIAIGHLIKQELRLVRQGSARSAVASRKQKDTLL